MVVGIKSQEKTAGKKRIGQRQFRITNNNFLITPWVLFTVAFSFILNVRLPNKQTQTALISTFVTQDIILLFPAGSALPTREVRDQHWV